MKISDERAKQMLQKEGLALTDAHITQILPLLRKFAEIIVTSELNPKINIEDHNQNENV